MGEAPRTFTLAAFACAFALAPGLAGCGSSRPSSAGVAQVVPVHEADFHISAPLQLKAGIVTFRVHNGGPDQHEFIVARSPSGTLPLRADGVTVDEETLEKEEAGSLEPAATGATRDLQVHLEPGRYVLFCNMTGHYMGGMHTALVVTQ